MRLIPSLMCALILSASAYAATNPSVDSVTGGIPRGSNAQSFDLQVTLSGISKPVSGSEKYADRLQIIIKEVSANTSIPFSDKAGTTTVDLKGFTLTLVREDIKPENNIYEGTIYLKVKSSQLVKTLGSADHFTLDVTYKGDDGEAKKEGVEIEKEKGVANEKPKGVSLEGTFKTIIATYDKADSIEFTAGGDKEPNGITLYLLEKGQGNVSLPAVVHDSSADSDKGTTTCTVNTNEADGEECVSCKDVGGKPTYIDNDSLPSTVTSTSASNAGKVSITNIPETNAAGEQIEYIGFLAYQPDSVQRSECYSASPQRNYTWSELTDPDNEATLKDPRCFIATATFGSPLHRHVQTFRDFRDAHLMGTWWGRALVETYYFVSPPLAWLVDHSETLKALSQMLLAPLAERLETK